jgi:hypothetical protein
MIRYDRTSDTLSETHVHFRTDASEESLLCSSQFQLYDFNEVRGK